jgi:hypothetical protein
MALLEKIRGWLKGRGAALDLSSVARVAQTADVLERNGRVAEAAVLIAEGLNKFPNDPALRAQQERVERQRLRERMAELTRTLQIRPDPMLALELVRIYRQASHWVSARRVCAEAIEKFPDNPRLRQAMGDILLEVFEQGGMPQDGLAAMENLERSIVLDPTSVTARTALVLLYGKIGASRRALHHAVMLLDILSPDPVGRIAKQAWAAQKPVEEDIEALVRKYARARETTRKPAVPQARDVSKALGLFKDVRGFKAAAVVASDGALWGVVTSEPRDTASLAAVVNELAGAASDCCSRMSIGGFVTAHIEGPGVAAYLKVLPHTGEVPDGPRATVFVLAADPTGRREVLARLAQI